MLYHCFAPLKEEYETIVVSPTELEKALVPTPEFMKQDDVKKRAATFRAGNIVEDIVWNTISKGKEAWLNKCKVWREYINPDRMHFFSSWWTEDKQFQWLYDWLEQVVDLSMPYYWWDVYNLRSHNAVVEIDASGYKVICKWECDWGIDWEYLYDCKTAKQKWKEDEMREMKCYQARFYSRMQFLAHPDLESISFTYLVFQKNKAIKLQNITHMLTKDECEAFVWDKLKEYLTKVKTWQIITSEWALDRL